MIGRKRPLNRRRPKRLLFIDAVTPAPDQNAGSIYVLNQMRILGDLGFEIRFVPEKYFVHSGKYTEQLQALGVSMRSTRRYIGRFATVLSALAMYSTWLLDAGSTWAEYIST